MVCWFSTIFFLSYNLLEFDDFIFYFQKTYNNQLKERYEDALSIHLYFDPDLWLQVGLFDGLDQNCNTLPLISWYQFPYNTSLYIINFHSINKATYNDLFPISCRFIRGFTEIKCINSLTLRLWTYGRPVVFKQLGARNRSWALSLQSLWPC